MSKSRSRNPTRALNPLLALLPNPPLARALSPSGGVATASMLGKSGLTSFRCWRYVDLAGFGAFFYNSADRE